MIAAAYSQEAITDSRYVPNLYRNMSAIYRTYEGSRFAQGKEGQVIDRLSTTYFQPLLISEQDVADESTMCEPISDAQMSRRLGMWDQAEAQWTHEDIDAINSLGSDYARPTDAPKKAGRASL